MTDPRRAEWLAEKEQAEKDAKARRKADRASDYTYDRMGNRIKRKRLKDCKPLFQASIEARNGMAELNRNRKRWDGA
jgi:hypothetical protein